MPNKFYRHHTGLIVLPVIMIRYFRTSEEAETKTQKNKNNYQKIMKNLLAILSITFMSFTVTGCEFIGDIFKAGIWVGIIVVIAVIAVIAFIVKLFSK